MHPSLKSFGNTLSMVSTADFTVSNSDQAGGWVIVILPNSMDLIVSQNYDGTTTTCLARRSIILYSKLEVFEVGYLELPMLKSSAIVKKARKLCTKPAPLPSIREKQ